MTPQSPTDWRRYMADADPPAGKGRKARANMGDVGSVSSWLRKRGKSSRPAGPVT